MDTGRLRIVRRQENCNRKFMCILNDMIKTRWENVNDCLKREEFEMGVRLDKSNVMWRRKMVQQRVLQQCLKMRKEKLIVSNSSARRFGSYGGKPLYAYARDIDNFITENHPRKRRQRKVRQALIESIERGKILDPVEIPKRMEKFFEKKWNLNDTLSKLPKNKSEENKREEMFKNKSIPPIRGLVNNFHKFTLDDDEDDQSREKGQEVVALDEDTSKLADSKRTEQNRGVLKLPPIQTSKAMISTSNVSQKIL